MTILRRVELDTNRHISVLQCYLTYNQEKAESYKQEIFEANSGILALDMKGVKTLTMKSRAVRKCP
jgi:hypothetical protein